MGNNKNKPKRQGGKSPGVNFHQQKGKGKRDRVLQQNAAAAERNMHENVRHNFPQFAEPDIRIPGPLLHDAPAFQPLQPQNMGLGMDVRPSGFTPLGLPAQQLSSPGLGLQGMSAQQLSSPAMGFAAAPGSGLGLQQQQPFMQEMQLQRSPSRLGQQPLSAPKLMQPEINPLQLSQQLQQSQRQVDQLLGEVQQWQANVNAVCREQEMLQSTNMALMAENDNLRQDNAQLAGQVGRLEHQVSALNNRLRSFLNGDKSGVDKTYTYDRSRMPELAQLLSCHMHSRSQAMDANRIHGCLRRCASSARKQGDDNPPDFSAEYLLLMSTARACKWWTERQMADIEEWLLLARNLHFETAPAAPAPASASAPAM